MNRRGARKVGRVPDEASLEGGTRNTSSRAAFGSAHRLREPTSDVVRRLPAYPRAFCRRGDRIDLLDIDMRGVLPSIEVPTPCCIAR
jgi:hypothetical protein